MCSTYKHKLNNSLQRGSSECRNVTHTRNKSASSLQHAHEEFAVRWKSTQHACALAVRQAAPGHKPYLSAWTEVVLSSLHVCTKSAHNYFPKGSGNIQSNHDHAIVAENLKVLKVVLKVTALAEQ